MDCALWLNRRKIRDAAEIPQNLDIASLRGYFLAGSLVEWLREHNGADYAAELEKIPLDCSELNSRISEIFGGSKFGESSVHGILLDGKNAKSAIYTNFGSYTSFGSFSNIWSSLAKFGRGSGSHLSTSGGSGIHEWEWEWLWKFYGSFGSFSLTSGGFHEWEWEWLFKLYGFYGSFGSFSLTSGGYESMLENLFTQLKFGSFSSFPWNLEELLGSYRGFPILDEYDLILLRTLMNCPLDRYGYGIHVI